MKPRRKSSKLAVTTAIAVAGVLAAACSSSGSSRSPGASGSSSGSAAAPIKIGMIIPINSPAVSQPQTAAAALAAVHAVNAAGGISGRPVSLDVCDNEFSPNQESACARKIVSDGVVATVGNFNAFGTANPILMAASIPSIGTTPVSAADYTAKNSYPLNSGSVGNAEGAIVFAKSLGLTKMSFVTTPAGQPAVAPAMSAAKAVGVTLAQQSVDTTQSDFAPIVAAVTRSGAQVAYLNIVKTQAIAFLTAYKSLGATFKVIVGTVSSLQDITDQKAALEGSYIINSVPPQTSSAQYAVLAQFRSELAKEAEAAPSTPGVALAAQTNESTIAWLAVHALADIMKSAGGSASAPGISSALDAAKSVNLGVIRAWTPSAAGPQNLSRISNRFEYISRISGGTPTLLPHQPLNAFPA